MITESSPRSAGPSTSLPDPPAVPNAPVRARRGYPRWAVRAGSLITVLALYEVVTAEHIDLGLRFDRLPTLTVLARSFAQHAGTAEYWLDITQSVIRILTGFALAAVLGVSAGIAVSRSRVLADLLQPIFEVLRPIPAIALVPVAILVFPSNEQGIVFITCTAAFFPILVSTRHAVRALPGVWEDAVRTMGGGRLRVLTGVVLPGILPGVFGGLSVGMGVAWICVISAEMISGDFGIGYRTWQSYTIVDYPGVLVGMATIGMLGWATAGLVEIVGRRVTHWLPAADRGARR